MSTTTIDSRLAEARNRIAEDSLAANLAEDWATFVSAVEAELRSWDAYLERLQTSVAAKAWKAREQAEAEIGNLRSRRIALGERLARAGGASDEARDEITAARSDLHRRADELSANCK